MPVHLCPISFIDGRLIAINLRALITKLKAYLISKWTRYVSFVLALDVEGVRTLKEIKTFIVSVCWLLGFNRIE